MIDFVTTKTVSEAVAEKVLDLIASGKLTWGQKLPPQRELAEMLRVGVSSLREGLQILQATGYVEVKRGRGTYIAANPAKGLTKNIALSMAMEADVRNLLEARSILEVGVASLAAKKTKQACIKKMQGHLEAMQRALETGDPEGSRYDLEFHLALAESVNNPLLHRFCSAIRSSLEAFIGEIGHTQKGLAYHWKVLEAIKERNSRKAGEAMKALLRNTERTYLRTRPQLKKPSGMRGEEASGNKEIQGE